MKLAQLIQSIKAKEINGSTEAEITGITADSRKAAPGMCFIAVEGTKTDGHKFIADTVKQGVSAVICSHIPEDSGKEAVFVVVDDTADALGKIASEFYGRPSERLTLAGVTGTNGKTTTATLLYKLFLALGFKAGLLSTVENRINDTIYPATQTTPDPITINRLMAEMVQAGCQYCFMEVSSHSIVQKRISGLSFRLGIFSNITLDHLDYHKTFLEYIKAKKMFFDQLPKTASALTNADDKNGMVMVQNTKAVVKTYGLKTNSDFHASILESNFEGMLLNICGKEMWTFLPGKFNAYNILAVYSSAVLLGQQPDDVLTALSGLHSVRGRFDIVNNGGITAIVDYAHTPDALENVLKTIQQIRVKGQKIITVCGCGGDRDKSKRPLMAKIAVQYSDKTILTSDNPRTEDPDAIIDDMLAGLDTPALRSGAIKITDRRAAIQAACFAAQKGDIILIAGKGHETYQDVMGVKSHFDDKEIVSQQLELLNNNK
ncbi:MAG: UDP-N-acetylmuramoyl-L-alanyl-D-glutamate--2,6-diaminopimelate ligase [Bacteroidales bacterium]|nr:UDP-N-acetylmuramoyl-L-alanyl-D-glutamate--2,6-diaminopimelate ligase [Bacteroidales bacterium]